MTAIDHGLARFLSFAGRVLPWLAAMYLGLIVLYRTEEHLARVARLSAVLILLMEAEMGATVDQEVQ
jgi:hypothetical protein